MSVGEQYDPFASRTSSASPSVYVPPGMDSGSLQMPPQVKVDPQNANSAMTQLSPEQMEVRNKYERKSLCHPNEPCLIGVLLGLLTGCLGIIGYFLLYPHPEHQPVNKLKRNHFLRGWIIGFASAISAIILIILLLVL